MNTSIVALIGLRCSGKSTVGRLVAEQLGVAFVDLDRRVVDFARRNAGARPFGSAGEVLSALGEAAFRELESRALESELARDTRFVLATGAGAVVREANRTRLISRARSVWLRVPLPTLQQRLARSSEIRPPLDGVDAVAEFPRVAREREPLYASIAEIALDCGDDPPPRVAERIVAALAENARGA